MHIPMVIQRSKEGVKSTGAIVPDVSELPDITAKNQTQTLRDIIMFS